MTKLELLHNAWSLIANVSDGSWDKQSAEWKAAAADFREAYTLILRARVNKDRRVPETITRADVIELSRACETWWRQHARRARAASDVRA